MKDEGVDDSDWLLFHRGQPEFFLLAFNLNYQAFILPLSSLTLMSHLRLAWVMRPRAGKQIQVLSQRSAERQFKVCIKFSAS